MYSAPCMKLTTRSMPKITASPRLSRAKNAPLMSPLKTCRRRFSTAGGGGGDRTGVAPAPAISSHLALRRAQWLERLARRDRAEDLHVIPRLLDLARGFDAGEVGVVDDAMVLLTELRVAGKEVGEAVPLQRRDDRVRLIGPGPTDCRQVLPGGRVVAGMGKGGAYLGAREEPVRPLA